MSKISDKDLNIRYAKYKRRVKEIMNKEKETTTRAIAKAALEFNVTERTVKNAMNNRPSKASKK